MYVKTKQNIKRVPVLWVQSDMTTRHTVCSHAHASFSETNAAGGEVSRDAPKFSGVSARRNDLQASELVSSIEQSKRLHEFRFHATMVSSSVSSDLFPHSRLVVDATPSVLAMRHDLSHFAQCDNSL